MRSAPITCHHVDVHGRNVHYRRCGAGPPVLLLHASPRSSQALLPLIEAAPAGVTVLAFDTPGCGGSAPLADPDVDAGDHATAFAETLDLLGIGRATVYGTQTGAAIAMAFAVRCPRRVATLVLDAEPLRRRRAGAAARRLPAVVRARGGRQPPEAAAVARPRRVAVLCVERDRHADAALAAAACAAAAP